MSAKRSLAVSESGLLDLSTGFRIPRHSQTSPGPGLNETMSVIVRPDCSRQTICMHLGICVPGLGVLNRSIASLSA